MHISKSFYADLHNARKAQANEAKLVKIVRLTKAGQPSKIAGDTHHFATVEQANEYIANMRRLNPTKTFNFLFI